ELERLVQEDDRDQLVRLVAQHELEDALAVANALVTGHDLADAQAVHPRYGEHVEHEQALAGVEQLLDLGSELGGAVDLELASHVQDADLALLAYFDRHGISSAARWPYPVP